MNESGVQPGDWVLQRYDHSWGGWRDLPTSIQADDPPSFADVADGLEMIEDILDRGASLRLRLLNRTTGEVRTSARGGAR